MNPLSLAQPTGLPHMRINSHQSRPLSLVENPDKSVPLTWDTNTSNAATQRKFMWWLHYGASRTSPMKLSTEP
jgi:hypothetical protein